MGSEGEMEEGVGWAEPTHTVQAEESGLERYMNKICIRQQELSELCRVKGMVIAARRNKFTKSNQDYGEVMSE